MSTPRHRSGHARGFTIVETLVVSGLLGSIALIAAVSIAGTSDLWATASTQNQVRTVAQLATRRMVDELRNATRAAAGSPPNLAIPALPNNTGITFYVPRDLDGDGLITDANGLTEWDNANPIQYTRNVAQQQLIRTRAGVQQVLANGVTDVRFDDITMDGTLGSNELRVRVTIQAPTSNRRTLTSASNEIVRLRN